MRLPVFNQTSYSQQILIALPVVKDNPVGLWGWGDPQLVLLYSQQIRLWVSLAINQSHRYLGAQGCEGDADDDLQLAVATRRPHLHFFAGATHSQAPAPAQQQHQYDQVHHWYVHGAAQAERNYILIRVSWIAFLLLQKNMASYSQDSFHHSGGPKYHDSSTQDGFEDIRDSIQQYEQLLSENLWLKRQISLKNQPQGRSRLAEEFYEDPLQDQSAFQSEQPGQDMFVKELRRKNNYLEQKNFELKKQAIRQDRELGRIEESEQWQNRSRCCPGKCYHRKYLQLLRIKSPLL